MLRHSVDFEARRLRRRANRAAFWGELSRHSTGALLAGGSIALLLRIFFDAAVASAALVFLGVALSPLSAFALARRRFLSAEGALAWLDVRTGGTGLVVARAESGDERWDAVARDAAARTVAAPRVRWRRIAAPPLFSLAFAAATLLVPVPDGLGPPPAIAAARIERLKEQFAVLEETVKLDETVAEEFRQRVEWLDAEGATANPEGAYEAADRLEERLGAEADAARESAERALDALAAGANGAASAAASEVESALEEVTKSGLGADPPESLTQALGGVGATLELPPGVELSSERLAAISSELSSLLAGKLGKLAEAGLLSRARPGSPRQTLGEGGQLAKLHVCDESCEKKPGGG